VATLQKTEQLGSLQLSIRSAEPHDAPLFLDYLQGVAGETDNLSFGPEDNVEFPHEELFIADAAQAPRSLFLLAFVGNELVGSISFSCGKRPKLSRSGDFGLSVRKAWWGRHIASALLQTLLDWAPTVGVVKVNLQVRADNARAIALYERFGFVREALLREQLRVKGTYHDLLWMGLKIGADNALDVPVPLAPHQRIRLDSPVHIRCARAADAPAILAMLEQVCCETELLAMGVEGPLISVEEERSFLENAWQDPGSLYLVACAGPLVVGMLSFSAGKRPRTKHAGDFSLAVLQAWSGGGVGRELVNHLIRWAHTAGLHKIYLQVRTENSHAVALYRSCGFEVEGLISRTVCYDGGCHDSLAMGLIVD